MLGSTEVTTSVVNKTWALVRSVAFLVIGAGIFLGAAFPLAVWSSESRERITFSSGDQPEADEHCGPDSVSGAWVCGPDSWAWHMGPGRRIQIAASTRSPDNARGFESALRRDDDCTGASVDWQIAADGTVFGAGTLTDNHAKRNLTERIAGPVHKLTLTATRTDSADCEVMVVLDRAAAAYRMWWFW